MKAFVSGGSSSSASSKNSSSKRSSQRTSSGSSNTTTNHDEIREWVEARGGFPAHVKRTEEGDDPGVLRIDYPGYSGQESLERIEWEQWFDWFDKNKLAFLYQDKKNSRFSKLVAR
ncbi:MAG TPA: hypothetical protein VFN10_23145 [Thermoanaerobaculia bacterium]|nr:hypothetical protein [Thermoanaerobaculia bacterium]